MRLDGSIPIKYGLRLSVDEKYKALKKHISILTSLPVSQILLAEVLGAVVKVSYYIEIICINVRQIKLLIRLYEQH